MFFSQEARALSAGTKQKQVTWVKGEPPIGDKKVQSSMNPKGDAEKTAPEEKQSKAKQLKNVFKEYGAVGVSFHIGISLISLGIFYLGLSSGINMAAVLCKIGFNESVVQSKMAAGTSTFVLAYALHKLFAPLRISITLVSVPFIVRYLRKTGLFKPPSSIL
ncbi:protein FAM210B, mitochondrial isoform X3 [Electrophorus electricus]|uniref:protein FAM210B, mitochondrial isoform X3 n=1 Tax=Electrophorus electricus TaxID=8005 RepID=UPI0015CFAA56|nr:protein FAM210B, mitochondrial isoform X3 [Electrophorus electricus]